MELTIKTQKKEELIDITNPVKEIVDRASDADSKACLIYSPHTTASILINENADRKICEDILDFLGKLAPKGGWKHDAEDGNGDSHIKAAVLGSSQIIPIQNGLLQLGKWQAIFLAEFDGPRERKVIVKIL